jgi:hypothetical protein
MDEAHRVVCGRHLQEVRKVEHLPDIFTNKVDWDGETSQVKRVLRKAKLI